MEINNKKLNFSNIAIYILYFTICLPFILLADEDYSNLTTFYQYRTCQYEFGDYEKIIQFSPQRTGSTLIYNVLRYLFEDEALMDDLGYYHKNKKKPIRNKVVKTHYSWSCRPYENCLIVTIRNPLDALMSRIRIHGTQPTVKELKKMANEHFSAWDLIEELKKEGRKVVVLRYEEFSNNLDYVFDVLEKEFLFTIASHDRFVLNEALDKENVKQYIRKFPPTFKSRNEKTLLIKNHIQLEENLDWDKQASKKAIIQVLLPHKSRIEKMGYFLDSNYKDKQDDEH